MTGHLCQITQFLRFVVLPNLQLRNKRTALIIFLPFKLTVMLVQRPFADAWHRFNVHTVLGSTACRGHTLTPKVVSTQNSNPRRFSPTPHSAVTGELPPQTNSYVSLNGCRTFTSPSVSRVRVTVITIRRCLALCPWWWGSVSGTAAYILQ